MRKTVALLSAAILWPASAADLSPGRWPAEERALAERLDKGSFAQRARIVEGGNGLIAATLSPIAIRAGIETLKQGGTAADAAAVVALTQVTTALGSYVSFAGIMQLVYYDARTRKVSSLNAGWNSYLGEKDPGTIPVDDMGPLSNGKGATAGAEGRKTLVPGFMAGIEAMHKRFGRLPFRSLFEPAVWYAENGVTVSPLLAGYFAARAPYLSRTPEGRRFLGQAGKKIPAAGDRFVQPDLAATLRAVATHGARYMYTGDWGRRFVEAVRAEGGQATMADMKRYAPLWEEPLSTSFLGHTAYGPGKSSDGGRQVLAALNLSEELGLDRAEPYYKDWKTFRTLSAVLQFVELGSFVPPEAAEFERRNGLAFSQDDRTTKAYAQAMAPLIGQVYEGSGAPQPALPQETPHHSDAIVVVDRWGNIAAMVHSINTVSWGTTGIVVGGVPVPDPAGFQQARLAAAKPGSRLPYEMAPVIVVDAGGSALAVASVGSSLVAETVRIILGTLGNHLDPETVMAAPPLLYNFEPLKAGETALRREQFVPEKAYSAEFLDNLARAGVRVSTKPVSQVWVLKGTAVMASFDGPHGTRRSVEIPGSFGFAAGW